MGRLHPLRATVLVLAAALAMAGAACLAPDNPYQRWQLLNGTIFDNARWIYERCHFDPAPIDIAFLGPSRTKQGVNAPQLEAALAARGISAHVVNFAILSPGRGADYAILEELLKTKKPRLIVVGVQESPDRDEHDAYRYLPPAGAILRPGLWRRLSYFPDVAYLPYRQLRLALAWALPAASGLSPQFVPKDYAGSAVDTTGGSINEGAAIINADIAAPPSTLIQASRRFRDRQEAHRPRSARARAVLLADDRAYMTTMLDLARRRGVKVAFLFIPYFEGPAQPETPRIYEGLGPVWNAAFVSDHADWWADFIHLSRAGATHLTDWLVGPVASALAGEPRAASSALNP
jgi:hypothetical protein